MRAALPILALVALSGCYDRGWDAPGMRAPAFAAALGDPVQGPEDFEAAGVPDIQPPAHCGHAARSARSSASR